MTKEELLKTYFGYDSFREGQELLINSILEGKDVLGIMPTGAGKSIRLIQEISKVTYEYLNP